MDKCPICLDDLDESSPALACGHRCHANCLGQLAEVTGSAPTRRGLVIACPSCRQKSRVAAQTPVVAFDAGDEVYALWGHRWYPGVVDAVLENGYEIAWDGEDTSNEVPAGRVRARVQPARLPAAESPAAETCVETTAPTCSMYSHVHRCGGISRSEGPVLALDDEPALACCRSQAGSPAQWRATRGKKVELSFIEETIGMVQGYEKHLRPGTWKRAYYLAGVGEAVESRGFTYVYCSGACKHALIYDVRHECRKVRALRYIASQSVERSLAPPPVASV